jgi:hypothetical protein
MCMLSQAFTGTLNMYELLGQYIPRSFLGAQVSCDHYNATWIVIRKSSLCVHIVAPWSIWTQDTLWEISGWGVWWCFSNDLSACHELYLGVKMGFIFRWRYQSVLWNLIWMLVVVLFQELFVTVVSAVALFIIGSFFRWLHTCNCSTDHPIDQMSGWLALQKLFVAFSLVISCNSVSIFSSSCRHGYAVVK